jgi:hypothetical protein
MRKNVGVYLIGMAAVGSVVFSMGAIANPDGVPVGDPPLSCTTISSSGSGGNYFVEAIPGLNGEFPGQVQCDGEICSSYKYKVTPLLGATISQSLFAVSADQDIFGTYSESGSAFIAPPGAGDSTTGFLKYAQHEFPVRFNSNKSSFAGEIVVKGTSAPRIGTAYIRGGKIDESCLIAGPGVTGSIWTPVTQDKTVVAVGGKCAGTLHYNARGEVVNITNVTPMVNDPDGLPIECFAGKPEAPPEPGKKVKFLIGGEPIQDVNAPDGITFGTGTTTIYLPSGWAICTASPCPGTVTYKYY